MADFTSSRGTDTTRLAHRVGREVVMQHEGITSLTLEGVDNLRVAS